MTKKTKLVHESLENRQLLANLCTAYHSQDCAADFGTLTCAFGTALTLTNALLSSVEVQSFTATVSPVYTNTNGTCTDFFAKDQGMPECVASDKFNVKGSFGVKVTDNSAANAACTMSFDKTFTIPAGSKLNVFGTAWTTENSDLTFSQPFSSVTAGTTVLTATAGTAGAGACNGLSLPFATFIRDLMCTDGSAPAHEWYSAASAAAPTAAAVPVNMQLSCTTGSAGNLGATTLQLGAIGQATIVNQATTVNLNKAINNASNGNIDMFSDALEADIFAALKTYDTAGDKTKRL